MKNKNYKLLSILGFTVPGIMLNCDRDDTPEKRKTKQELGYDDEIFAQNPDEDKDYKTIKSKISKTQEERDKKNQTIKKLPQTKAQEEQKLQQLKNEVELLNQEVSRKMTAMTLVKQTKNKKEALLTVLSNENFQTCFDNITDRIYSITQQNIFTEPFGVFIYNFYSSYKEISAQEASTILGHPLLVYWNTLDNENCDIETTINDIRTRLQNNENPNVFEFSRKCIPLIPKLHQIYHANKDEARRNYTQIFTCLTECFIDLTEKRKILLDAGVQEEDVKKLFQNDKYTWDTSAADVKQNLKKICKAIEEEKNNEEKAYADEEEAYKAVQELAIKKEKVYRSQEKIVSDLDEDRLKSEIAKLKKDLEVEKGELQKRAEIFKAEQHPADVKRRVDKEMQDWESNLERMKEEEDLGREKDLRREELRRKEAMNSVGKVPGDM